jgi:hypothetical protein
MGALTKITLIAVGISLTGVPFEIKGPCAVAAEGAQAEEAGTHAEHSDCHSPEHKQSKPCCEQPFACCSKVPLRPLRLPMLGIVGARPKKRFDRVLQLAVPLDGFTLKVFRPPIG